MGATLYLVRHGETEWSRAGRHTGTSDLPLTDAGEATARSLAPILGRLEPDLVLTSPRLRARRTASLAGFAEAAVEEDLAEWDYGDYEGLTTPEIRQQVPDWSIWTHPVPGGESAEQMAARLDRVIAHVRDAGGQSLVFAHGHSLRVLAARWLGLPVSDGRHFFLDTATYSVLGDDRGQDVVLRWNVPAAQ
ncbi:histidine phosphatase family protein [Aeromicrobium sp. CTD01-1L150]|uniref:histidine phosphatase family protein n=1 Tax=Aeromicrobium sp. CTD01-1L150 TaxID=3341830 RepID=UPI0035C152DB